MQKNQIFPVRRANQRAALKPGDAQRSGLLFPRQHVLIIVSLHRAESTDEMVVADAAKGGIAYQLMQRRA